MNPIARVIAELAAAAQRILAAESANAEEQPFYLSDEDRARLARTTLRMLAEQRGGVSVRDCTRAARLWVLAPEETPLLAEHLQGMLRR